MLILSVALDPRLAKFGFVLFLFIPRDAGWVDGYIQCACSAPYGLKGLWAYDVGGRKINQGGERERGKSLFDWPVAFTKCILVAANCKVFRGTCK